MQKGDLAMGVPHTPSLQVHIGKYLAEVFSHVCLQTWRRDCCACLPSPHSAQQSPLVFADCPQGNLLQRDCPTDIFVSGRMRNPACTYGHGGIPCRGFPYSPTWRGMSSSGGLPLCADAPRVRVWQPKMSINIPGARSSVLRCHMLKKNSEVAVCFKVKNTPSLILFQNTIFCKCRSAESETSKNVVQNSNKYF